MRVFKRGKSWYLDYRVNGKRIMKSFGRQKTLADLYMKDLELKEARGELGIVEQRITVQDFIDKYLDYCKINKSTSTYKVDRNRLNQFRRFVGEMGINKLREINYELMEQFKSRVLNSAGPTTFNHHLELIKAMLRKAVDWRYLRSNPLSGFKPMKNSSARQVRFLTHEEIFNLLSKADSTMKSLIRVFLLTGMRRSELVYLEWQDIDFKNQLITIQAKPEQGFHPKSYRPRTIPMSTELEKVLLDLPQKGKYVFDNGLNQPLHYPNTYYKKFTQILKKAGIKDANLHTLRHTFASHLVMSGVDLRTVQELLGHSSIKVTEIYSHLCPSHTRKAVECLRFGNKMETNSILTLPSS